MIIGSEQINKFDSKIQTNTHTCTQTVYFEYVNGID